MREDYHAIFGERYEGPDGTGERNTDRQIVSGFLDQWGWEYNVELCMEASGVNEDTVYKEWSVQQFLNKISYIKDKNKFLKSVNGIS